MYYFDSYGIPPTQECHLLFGKSPYNKFYYNTIQYQDINTDTCGYFCLYVLYQICKGRSFNNITVNDFSHDINKNEEMINNFFNL
jgi:hypothetical protein